MNHISLLLSFFSILGAATANFPAQLPLGNAAFPGSRLSKSGNHREHNFRLTDVFHHGIHLYPNLHRRKVVPNNAQISLLDIQDDYKYPVPSLIARSRPTHIRRLGNRSPVAIEQVLQAGRAQAQPVRLAPSAWTTDEISGPNVTDKDTLMTLAIAAGNAYIESPHTGEWQDVRNGFNYSLDFGWEEDGLRGHIYADENNSTVIIGLKGTSTALFDGAGSTTQDKENDNLFFGCCCGQGTSWWSRQVCNCQTATYTCNNTCVSETLRIKNRYYEAAKDMYFNVTELYPDSEVWLSGHSLGGSLCSLLGMTVGRPAVTFEAPGEAMAAKRLGLPTPPGYNLSTQSMDADQVVYHFGHTADPLFMGTCNGANSACSIYGYSMESVCHTGKECIYDTVKDKGWGSHLINHKVQTMIHQVIETYNATAECKTVVDCVDCFNWKYYESHNSSTTTKTSSPTPTFTQTRTNTCQTPGWWGCLDPTSTSVPTTTATYTTTTCLNPGWFGCNDLVTTTVTTTDPPPPSDSPSTSMSTSSIASAPMTTPTRSSTCITPGLFWGCRDKTSAAPPQVPSSTPASATPSSKPQITKTGL